jgi:hypothetical protein
VPALIEITDYERFLKSTIIKKTMHFSIDSNAFVRGYLILGE